MRTTKILSRYSESNTFYRILCSNYVVCAGFAEELIGERLKTLSVKLTLSTKNPKRKGFKKILFKNINESVMNGITYDTITKQQTILKDLGVEVGDCYWMKGEVVN